MRKSLVMPKAYTSSAISSTSAASLVDLLGRVELGLVADQVVDALAGGAVGDHGVPEVEAVVHLERGRREAEARRQHRLAGAVVPGEHQPGASGGAVVVVHLQGEGRLAAVHRAAEEHQLGHVTTP
ncbi:hypothetical protein GCM10025868_05610 [Angustibacter aerolatus]|uniref:Uncharacterized protein n=1 Tax=Angustibacter aerolatus TaxID=1162965 RepID=A0ABQ6JEV1_9ACTN|nr:hypothetical protein GCM10025868_05610 [Angustibacter aerolatus]